MTNSSKILDELGENASKIERKSKQTPAPNTFFASTYNWVKKLEREEPEWGKTRARFSDNRLRDEWLAMMVKAEPHLSSVLSTSVTLDANRQYRLIGGRNQVQRFIRKFNEFDWGGGFRSLQEANALNYYGSDLGAIVEIETDGANGPLLSLYHTDPTRFQLGQKGVLKYHGNKKVVNWKPSQYYRLASQKSTQDKYNRLGWCAVSRCVKIAQQMVAIIEHNLEKLGHTSPLGILFITAEDITQEQWEEAMQARRAEQQGNTGNQYYDGVLTIVDRSASGKLLALSELPDGFDYVSIVHNTMQEYAAAFGRPIRDFWSPMASNFGGGNESKVQKESATYGGSADFILASEEQIQWLLPSSMLFEYEVEDSSGKMVAAEVDKILIENATSLLDVGVTIEQAKEFLVSKGVIPSDWIVTDEAVAENGILRERLLETEQIQTALEENPDEPIIMYQSSSFLGGQKVKRLWDNKRDAIGKSWRVVRKIKKRATIEDFDENQGEVGNFMFTAASEAYLAENEDRDETEEEAYLLALAMLNGGEPLDDDTVAELTALMALIVPASVLIALLAMRDKSNETLLEAYLLNPELWNSRLEYFRGLGMILADPEQLFMWVLGDTDHCDTCLGQEGIVKTGLQWFNDGILPQGSSLLCGGFRCQCQLVPV